MTKSTILPTCLRSPRDWKSSIGLTAGRRNPNSSIGDPSFNGRNLREKSAPHLKNKNSLLLYLWDKLKL